MYPKNIIVIGGGTAGWLTALYLKNLCIHSNVTLIESSKIGILGAGEGSVPTFVEILHKLKISQDEFITKTKSTFKIGIDFENWSSLDDKYEHYFLGDRNYSFHFDAILVANFLKEIGEKRGINVIDGVIKNFTLKENKDIEKIILDNDETLECDFVFDCSGFKRLCLNSLYNEEWVSFKDYLTVNSAVPFFLPREEKDMYKPTRAIAMKYGWMWMIPLQHRIGCGYVFNDKFINDEDAKKEVGEFLKKEITFNRTLTFDAGCYKNVWVNNTISVGLSTGFIEPLEATSISTTINQLFLLDKYFHNNQKDIYNTSTFETYFEHMLFIYFHYICNREDTEFWKEYKRREKVPEKLFEIVDENFDVKLKTNTELRTVFKLAFGYVLNSWLVVSAGARSIKKLL
jgi:tryptophan halogenase